MRCVAFVHASAFQMATMLRQKRSTDSGIKRHAKRTHQKANNTMQRNVTRTCMEYARYQAQRVINTF